MTAVTTFIRAAPNKSCNLDHLPTNMLKVFPGGSNLIICVESFLFSYFSTVQDSYFINTLTFQKIMGQMPPPK